MSDRDTIVPFNASAALIEEAKKELNEQCKDGKPVNAADLPLGIVRPTIENRSVHNC
jgi:hypothetical protein